MTATLQRTGRVGLVGTGGIGKAHAEAAGGLSSGRLAGVADIDPAAAAAVGATFGVPSLPVSELADPDRFDLVVVASPPSTHPDVVIPLLRAGVPVMCEKPLAVNLDDARQLAAVSAETGTPLTMATKFRFVDDVARTRELIARGALGDVLKIEVTFAGRVDMSGRWNADRSVAGGGVLIDNATHAVDLVHHLVGDIVEVAAVHGRSGQPVDVEDSSTLLGRTADGVLAQVDVTWSFRRLSPVVPRPSRDRRFGGDRLVRGAGGDRREPAAAHVRLGLPQDRLVAGQSGGGPRRARRRNGATRHPGGRRRRGGGGRGRLHGGRTRNLGSGQARAMIDSTAFVHPTALIEPKVEIGPGTSIWDNAHLRRGAVVGADCIVGGKSYLANSVRVGDRCKINAMVYLCSGVSLGDGVFIAAHTTFTNDFYPRACVNDLSALRPSEVDEHTTFTTVQDGVTIGAAATVGSDLVIGRFAVVGMGAVVTRTVPGVHAGPRGARRVRSPSCAGAVGPSPACAGGS